MPKAERPIPVLPLRDIVQFPGAVNTVLIVRAQSRRAVEKAMESNRRLFAVTQRDSGEAALTASDLYETGTISEILQWSPLANGTARVVLKGHDVASTRGQISEKGGLFWAKAVVNAYANPVDERSLALSEEVKLSFSRVAELHRLPAEAVEAALNSEMPAHLPFGVAQLLNVSASEKQMLLEEAQLTKRLELVYSWLRREELSSDFRRSLRADADARLAESQREYLLREQLRIIQEQLGICTHPQSADLRERLATKAFPTPLREFCSGQITSLEALNPESVEASVALKHIETLLRLPDTSSAATSIDLAEARRVLGTEHFGLEPVKKRIIEYLAVRKLMRGHRSPPLCFVGPPGVGKTSFAKSIAHCLGRKFVSVSLAGVRDEAEIRGHRRTYVGAQPGRIVQALIRSGVLDPVCLIDEIDKMAFDTARHDPTAALLELLDPAQNGGFQDHFIDFPLDISGILFVATANTVDRLPAALVDRLELIEFPSYTQKEKFNIAKHHLLEKVLSEHGLDRRSVTFEDDALRELVGSTVEPGVRGLYRNLAAVCRDFAASRAEKVTKGACISKEYIENHFGEILGLSKQDRSGECVGAINALVVAAYGGDTIRVECATMEPLCPAPQLCLTGSMGQVMRESAETALSCLRGLARSNSALLSLDVNSFRTDLHIHATEAGKIKEGPSAGLPIFLALASALCNKPIPNNVAATGEITLTGSVLPVGGMREKLAAAQRYGLRVILIPAQNVPELTTLPADLLEDIQIIPVSHVREAIETLWSAPSLKVARL